jgi:cob(I)alamin adenosyltransferase
LIKGLDALTGFIRTNRCNGELMFLRSLIREAELSATKAVQEGELNINHIKYLNFLSDYVFAMIWYMSAENSELELWCGL